MGHGSFLLVLVPGAHLPVYHIYRIGHNQMLGKILVYRGRSTTGACVGFDGRPHDREEANLNKDEWLHDD